MKKVTWVFYVLLVTFLGKSVLLGQIPSRDNFNFIFENNYENDKLGRYTQTDFTGDWNFGSSKTIPAHQVIDILSDSDTRYNKVMRAYFAKGTVGPDTHGAYWESPIPGCTEIYFSYDVKFKPGFQWVIGGKIPGVFGGKMAPGVMPGPTDGFSARVMWKENGRPVAYIYHQNQTTLFGNSYYWGDFAFTSGRWYNVTIRVVLNTIGSANGIYEGYIDGKLMFQKKDLKYRGVDAVKIEKMNISMFFGGSTQDWAPTRDEWIDTDNFVAYTYTSKAPNVPRGIQASSANRILLHPYYNFGGNTVTIPAAPSSLVSTSVTSSSIALKWNDNCANEQGYKIECRKDGETGYSQVATVGANATTYTHSSLAQGKPYSYRVRAYNSAGNSAYSNILNVTTTTTASSTPQPSGLIANYTFEGNANDVSGSGRNGTLVNGPTYSTSLVKQGSKSLLLDGVNDYVDLGAVNFGDQFTFASWVYIPSGTTNIKTIVANTASGATSNGFKIMVNTYGTADRMIRVETGNGTQTGATLSAASVFVLGQWNHIAVTMDRTNRIARIYLNGADVTKSCGVASNFAVNSATRLGIMTNSTYPIKGNLDDVRIYNRVLAASEVQSIFKAGTLKSTDAAVATSLVVPMDSPTDLVAYPNPFMDKFTVRSSVTIKSIEIFDLSGAKVMQQDNIDNNEIIIENLPDNTSIYMVRILKADGTSGTVKVLKNK